VPALLTRREILRALAASAALPVQGPAPPGQRRTVGIVGGGMAGVSLAWMLDGVHDVVLFEARDTPGGNVRSVELELEGVPFVVDVGAQYFHPEAYPLYTALLRYLGLHQPGSTAGVTRPFPASFTLTSGLQSPPLFVSPALPERWWPLAVSWNSAGLAAFGVGFLAARIREELDQPWDITLEQWLPTLGLSRAQWEGMLLPWAASLFSGSVEQARGMSARAAMIFAAKALPPNPLDPIAYYVLTTGMIEVLSRMLARCSTVTVLTGARVLGVSRHPTGRFVLRTSRGHAVHVDELVFASSGPPTAQLVVNLPGTEPQQAALNGMEFHDARLALHTDPMYAPRDPILWSFLNSDRRGDFCEASMWLASVVDSPPATAARLWKSWITHRARPRQVLHEATFTHLLPSPSTLRAQESLNALQGQDGLWFAGGYLHPYDSQETALVSALRVALGLHAASPRSHVLSAVSGAAPSPRPDDHASARP
jgi:uncharacterized protein